MCVLLNFFFISNKHDTLFAGGLDIKLVKCALRPEMAWRHNYNVFLLFSSGSFLIIFNFIH